MEKVHTSELASGATDAFRTSVCSAEPNFGKVIVIFTTNLGSSFFGP